MNWDKFNICGGGVDLKCPARSLQGNSHEVYEKFIHVLCEYTKLGELPTKVEPNLAK